jgi:hypothetical protein
VPIAEEADWYPLIEPGLYELALVRVVPFKHWNQRKWEIVWRVIAGPALGTSLSMYVTRPEKDQRLTASMKLVRLFQVATDKRVPPKDLHRIHPETFIAGCAFVGVVETVTHDMHRDELGEVSRYSVVRALLRRADGVPPRELRR